MESCWESFISFKLSSRFLIISWGLLWTGSKLTKWKWRPSDSQWCFRRGRTYRSKRQRSHTESEGDGNGSISMPDCTHCICIITVYWTMYDICINACMHIMSTSVHHILAQRMHVLRIDTIYSILIPWGSLETNSLTVQDFGWCSTRRFPCNTSFQCFSASVGGRVGKVNNQILNTCGIVSSFEYFRFEYVTCISPGEVSTDWRGEESTSLASIPLTWAGLHRRVYDHLYG